MNYWMFQCNPMYWGIEEFLEQWTEVTTWKVRDYQRNEVNIGDLGIIRVGKDNRTKKTLNGRLKLKSGIYAVVKIIDAPKFTDDIEDMFWAKNQMENAAQKKWRVKIRVLKNLISNPLLIESVRNHPELDNSAIIEGRLQATWSINKSEFNTIQKLADKSLSEIVSIENEHFYLPEKIEKLIKKYENATPVKKEIISKKIERGEIAQVVKRFYNYKCMICESMGKSAIGFKKRDGNPYVETHHFFPVSNLQKGSLGINNLMTVCPNHHRQLHFGNVNIVESTENHFKLTIDGKELTIIKKPLA